MENDRIKADIEAINRHYNSGAIGADDAAHNLAFVTEIKYTWGRDN